MTRHTRAVRRLIDETSTPPRDYEAVTACPHALAFWMGGTWDHPDHSRDGSLVTGMWFAIPHHAPADVAPVAITYDRRESPPFAVGEARFAMLGEAMDCAADLVQVRP
jgi:hypothetical protein